jgi:hypothetical protein
VSQQPKNTLFGGGLDLRSAPMAISPGSLIDALNYESVLNGYRRMDGYERYDGHTKPSLATYWVIGYTPSAYVFAANDLLTGAVSGATARILPGIVAATGTLVLTDVVGTFLPAENLLVLAVVRAVTSSGAVLRGAATDVADAANYTQAVADARSRIAAVPGSGPVRGVWIYSGDRYAFRDASDGLSGTMWKSTATGWALQALGRKLAFTAGAIATIPEGSVITGSTSGATATVKRVVDQTGSYTASTAVGYLILAGQTGTFIGETIKVGGVVRGTIAGNSAAITIAPGGRYRFQNYNFYGSSNLRRMYGSSSVDFAFEWDGTTYTPIVTGMPVDKPTHIACHKKHLWLGFPGGSLQNSGVGTPLQFQAILGAAEIGVGDDITALIPEYVDTLVVFSARSTSTVSGTSSADFALKTVSIDAGARSWTAQTIGTPMYLDDNGMRELSTTQEYGNFNIRTMSDAILPLLKAKAAANIRPLASMTVRGKGQYRLFFTDGTGLTAYMAKRSPTTPFSGLKPPEFIPFDLGGLIPTCSCTTDDGGGDQSLLIGSGSGMVYELDAGTSQDGAPLDSYATFAPENMGSTTMNKVFSRVELQIEADSLTNISVAPTFTSPYDDPPPLGNYNLMLTGGNGGFWNSFIWNEFVWSSQTAGLAYAEIEGFGRDVSLTILCNSATQAPHILKGQTIHFSKRGLVK